MAGRDWSREEVEATVADYLDMFRSEMAGVPYSKAEHRRRLGKLLNNRSEPSIEYKHANISAAMIDLGCGYISGYKPRHNYQRLLYEVLSELVFGDEKLLAVVEADVRKPGEVPTVDDILSILTEPPKRKRAHGTVRERPVTPRGPVNYLEMEARNRSLGAAGEEFVLRFEQARLLAAGQDRLAGRIEHVAQTRGDGDGFDILSFEPSGAERLIEVKTTKYGAETPFYVTRNELVVSQDRAPEYHLCRVFEFRASPKLFELTGALSTTCHLDPVTYSGRVA